MNDIVKYTDERGQLVQFTAEEVRQRLCPNIDDKELALVMGLCQAQNLNPFTKDVYIIKYGNSPASIVTGKEVFTKRATAKQAYQGFEAGVTFLNARGEVCHREGSAVYKAANETLVGGWCRVYVEGRKPFYDEVTMEEYSTGKSGWAKMPATMIRKVALVHCLREAFPDDFQGLYAAEEMGKAGEQAELMEAEPEPRQAQQAAPIAAEFVEMASDYQLQSLDDSVMTFATICGKSPDDVLGAVFGSKTMRAIGCAGRNDMTAEQAEAAIALLGSWIERKMKERRDTEGADASGTELAEEDIAF